MNGDDTAHRDEARTRFLAPLLAHLRVAGLGHVSEIADGDPPHTPRGCPFQAWSTGELIRALARTAPTTAAIRSIVIGLFQGFALGSTAVAWRAMRWPASRSRR